MIPKISVTKEFSFESAHVLGRHLLKKVASAIYGPCSQVHGHTYIMQVTVTGDVHTDGMVLNFSELKGIVDKTVIKELDHTFLNEVKWLSGYTVEQMLPSIWKRIMEYLPPGILLTGLRIYEGGKRTAYAELRR